MLTDLISGNKIKEAYEEQISCLNAIGKAEDQLLNAKYQLERAIGIMYQLPDFKPGKNEEERTALVQKHCPEEYSEVRKQESMLDTLKTAYRMAGLKVDMYQTLIKYIDATKDLPEQFT